MRVRTISAIAAGFCLAVSGVALSVASADPPAGTAEAAVELTTVAEARNPSAGTAGPGGTLWIAERAGTVRVLDGSGLGEPVLDISDETTATGERGLLGIAFDPDFQHFYISFTDREGTSTVDEFAVADGALDPGSRRTVLTQEQPYANHNGGQIAFGPDGMLYIGLGDGGAGGDPHDNGQNLGTLLGKLLRIDPAGDDPYAIPEDNPFADDARARGEIWAYGLRNPWRFSFDAETGDLWIGDVGQNRVEEIDRAPGGSPGGENYGWGRMEGSEVFDGEEPANHVPPVHEYGRGGLGCSVTGGFVYRGTALPELAGQYLFSDYCDGTVRALQVENGEVTGQTDLGVSGGSVVSFVQGGDNELYVLDLGGPVQRLDPAG
ncbi:PQQ-dependent sugar dehydrogenase [Streptomyces synnematoformans]|uniref:PQQ-dependent sugar dehydrogenase n=1 Tax=Streptomyces synnematoformans TaxID=415721 RepID=A0ABP4KD26_9ACTN